MLTDAPEGCPRCRERQATHEDRLAEIRETFPGLDVQVLPDVGPAAEGRDALERLAARVEI